MSVDLVDGQLDRPALMAEAEGIQGRARCQRPLWPDDGPQQTEPAQGGPADARSCTKDMVGAAAERVLGGWVCSARERSRSGCRGCHARDRAGGPTRGAHGVPSRAVALAQSTVSCQRPPALGGAVFLADRCARWCAEVGLGMYDGARSTFGRVRCPYLESSRPRTAVVPPKAGVCPAHQEPLPWCSWWPSGDARTGSSRASRRWPVPDRSGEMTRGIHTAGYARFACAWRFRLPDRARPASS